MTAAAVWQEEFLEGDKTLSGESIFIKAGEPQTFSLLKTAAKWGTIFVGKRLHWMKRTAWN